MRMHLSLERFFSEFFALLSLFVLTVDCYETSGSGEGNYSNNKEWFKMIINKLFLHYYNFNCG